MIYDFALEPELVASWHDCRVAYPFLSQMGPGQCRVACVFPSAAWRSLVMNSVQASFPESASPKSQRARRNIDILLQHLHNTGIRRNGRIGDGESWLIAATREHGTFPFGGIVVRTSAAREPYLVVADQVGEQDFPAWTPPAPSVARRPEDLANALAPILRCATQLRFVDPYFDAGVDEYFRPMQAFLRLAQNRRSVGELQIQIHLAVSHSNISQVSRIRGQHVTEDELAAIRLDACERLLKPVLRPGVELRALAWGEGPQGLRMHNRYVLTEVGGIAVQHGLDGSVVPETDDLTILSKEQHEKRWAEYSVRGAPYRLICHRIFTGIPK